MATKEDRSKGRAQRSMARQGRQCRVRELVLPLWLNFAARFRGNVRACAITCTMPRQRFVQSKPTNHGGRLPLVLANGRVGPRSQRSHMFFLRLVIYTRAGLHDRDDSRGQGGEGGGESQTLVRENSGARKSTSDGGGGGGREL